MNLQSLLRTGRSCFGWRTCLTITLLTGVSLLTLWFSQSVTAMLIPQTTVFTDAQAARGQALYEQKCASCHGQQLEGGSASALSGSRFLTKWGGGNKTVDDLYYITRTQMPYGAGGSLTAQQYIDIVACMLKANGYQAGERELPVVAEQLKQIVISPQRTAATARNSGAAQSSTGAAQAAGMNAPQQAELNAAATNTTDWLHSNHDYGGQRYVDLKQINQQNVSSLRPACMFQAGDTQPLHNNPVVYRGVMYITTSRSTIALDAANCRIRWRHNWKPKSLEVWPPNRGAAVGSGRVVRATTDGYLFALDMENGKVLWERKVVDSARNEGSFNMAPLIYENMVIIGLGISEQGVRGWLGAFNLENGEPVWRFNTVPQPGEPGAETWGRPDALQHGGGAVWAPLSLDPEAGIVYAPIANPAPDFFDDVRPGDNLYTCSLVAIDARTGKLKWHYQAVPHDTHDWDVTQVSPLFTARVGSKQRKLVAVSGKDGLMHVLDRETHEHLYQTAFTTRENTEVPLSTTGVHVCPGVLGGAQWNGPAFNPRTNMLYMPAVDWCGTFAKAKEVRHIEGQLYMGGYHRADPIEKARGWLTAIDASTGKVAWRFESAKPMLAAVTTTSADLIFTGELNGDMIALDAKTGKVLYRFYTGGPLNAGVISYAINGKQYVAVASGSTSALWRQDPGSSTIVVFALP